MTRGYAIIISIFVFTLACNHFERHETVSHQTGDTTGNIALPAAIPATQIDCDSVYPNQGYTITMNTFDTIDDDSKEYNCLFELSNTVNGHVTPFFFDSIFSSTQEVRFDDFDNDGVRDILVHHISDARSNRTYYLYLIDTIHDRARKIRGFDEIKNPHYIPKYDLIDNYVVSGENWTSFYQIHENDIHDFGITIYDNDQGDGSYDKAHKEAIKMIMAKRR